MNLLKQTILYTLFLTLVLSLLSTLAPMSAQEVVGSGNLLVEVAHAGSEFQPKTVVKDIPKFKGATGEKQLESGIKMVTGWVKYLIGAIAILMIVIGGSMYVTARGDDAKMTKAKTTLVFAAVGLVVVALAEPIQNAIYSGGKGPDVEAAEKIVLGLTAFFSGFLASIAIAAIIFGGFQIITARGDEGKMSIGKRNVLYAVIGLFVAALSDFVVNNVVYPKGRLAGAAEVTEGVRAITGIINWALGFVGVISVALMIYGGVQMMLSRGEESKYIAGKKTLIYAVIGLMVVMISYSIVGFVFRAIGKA